MMEQLKKLVKTGTHIIFLKLKVIAEEKNELWIKK